MPLGLFSSGKAQVLGEEKTAGSKKKEPKQLSENKCKGYTLKLESKRVIIEKQIAEGGFAIVYLVSDRKNIQQKYALKRQLIKENSKQLEACQRELEYLKDSIGHKNIVQIYDGIIAHRGNDFWEALFLTDFYPKTVLQLMNERIAINQYLTNEEILNIFTDMVEAVTFLHYKYKPIIHRDLKVENILITGDSPPVYVLCDFGSATQTPLNVSETSYEHVQGEVERYTTMCYRSPEMIDLYSGYPIGLPGDMWAMGVLLYRLSYFALPFEESPLAIQSGNYQFPSFPLITDEIKSIIYMLLDVDVERRPSIIPLAHWTYEAAGKPLSRDIYLLKMKTKFFYPIAPIEYLVRMMKSNKKPRNQREIKSPAPVAPTPTVAQPSEAPKAPEIAMSSGETSVAPRLRPKATTIVPNVLPSISPVPKLKIPAKPEEQPKSSELQNAPKDQPTETTKTSGGPLSCPLMQPADLGFKDLDKPAEPRDRAQTDGKRQVPVVADAIFQQQHRRNVSDTSQISRSAFKPYSSQNATKPAVVRSVEDVTNARPLKEWNPFLAAPFSTTVAQQDDVATAHMDDSHFGAVFDEIRRSKATDSDTSSIDSRDPFGAAPFDQLTVSTSSSAHGAQLVSAHLPGAETEEDEQKLISESEEEAKTRVDKEAEPTKNEEDSEIDEQRMNDRRRYSYENIDGVGDDASSDSRGKTDRDDSEDDDSRRGGDTSHDEDSQNTVGSEDGEGGSRPLLEDDGLEDDDDHELISSFGPSSTNSNFAPLFVGTHSSATNPFLRDELTPKMGSDDEWDLGDRWTDRRDTVFERPSQQSTFAPATLPRQVTPLVCRFKPELPTAAPVSIIPSMSTTSFPEAVRSPEVETPREPIVGTLISVGAPTEPPVVAEVKNAEIRAQTEVVKEKEEEKEKETVKKKEKEKVPDGGVHEKTLKLKKKAKKEAAKKEKETRKMEKASSEMETDGSEAEMWQAEEGKKKKKSTFGLRSSHPSIAPNELQFVAPIPLSTGKKSSKTVKKSSVGNINASFVNTSFQPEDHTDEL